MKQGEFDFDGDAGERAKRDGMDLAAKNRAKLLERVRMALVNIALSRASREATADDAQAWLIAAGYRPHQLGNAAGSLFLKEDWLFTGRWRKSLRVTNHARQNRIWRLR